MTKADLDPYLVARVIASRAFAAVRGQRSSGTGAAPAHKLAELRLEGMAGDKRTVARKATRGRFPGSPASSTATPFDYAMAALFDWDINGGKEGFALGVDLVASILGDYSTEEILVAVASLFRTTVQSEIDDPQRRFLTGFAVQAMAIEFVNETEFRRDSGEQDRDESEALAWAGWLLERRRMEAERTTESFVALLSFGLLLLGRRPRPGYTLVDVVLGTQALWTGSLLQYHLNPTAFPDYRIDRSQEADPATGLPQGDGPIERMMVDLMLGMTEGSVFAARIGDATDSDLIAGALSCYRTSRQPVSISEAAQAAGIDSEALRDEFTTPTDLAQACFGYLAGEWDGFYRFAEEFRTAAPSGAEALLVWIQNLSTEYPVLLQVAGFRPGDRAFDELTSLIATMHSRQRHGQSASPSPSASDRARSCLLAAAERRSWH